MNKAAFKLTAKEVGSIRQPIELARTLPRRAFTSPDFFEWERSRIAERNWLAACFADQIPDPGDGLPIDVWGIPLVAVRGLDHRIRTFHNVCPYDGCPVAMAPFRGTSELRVTYHGWRYDLKGRLLDAPYWAGRFGNGFDTVPHQHRALTEVACGVHLGVLFVNLFSTPTTLAAHVEPLKELLYEFDLEDLRATTDEAGQIEIFESLPAANWKTFAENDCLNILHESFTHELYAASPDIPRVSVDGTPKFEVVARGNLFGFGYREADVAQTYPTIDIPHLGRGHRPERGFFLQLYPNLSLAVMDTLIAPIIQFPERVDQTRVTGATLVRTEAAGPAGLPQRRAADDLFATAAAEDTAVIEAIQQNRRSPGRDQGFYAPFWDKPHYLFTNRVLDDLLAADSQNVAAERPGADPGSSPHNDGSP